VRQFFVTLAKIVGLLAIVAGLFALTSVAAFLVTYAFIDGSEPENPGTDLGAGFALGLLLLAVCLPASVYGGIVLGLRFLFGMSFGDMFANPNRAGA
jgi:hypothetical protein